MIYKVCTQYTWRAAHQDKKPKMTPANNYGGKQSDNGHEVSGPVDKAIRVERVVLLGA